MSLPDSRNTTYVAGGPPTVKAADLNAMQDNHVDQWRALRGNDFLIADDFTGSSIDTSKWIVTDPSSKFTLIDVPGSYGNLHFISTVNAGSSIQTRNLYLGLNDFRTAARLFNPQFGGGVSTVSYGVLASVNRAYFDRNSGNWRVSLNGSFHATGVAVSAASFQLLEIRRESGLFQFLIDGVLVYSEALAMSLDSSALTVSASRDTSGTTQLDIDHVKLWARR